MGGNLQSHTRQSPVTAYEGNPRLDGKAERPRDLCKPSHQRTIWHKAVFKVGPVAGPKPTRIRQGQKYLQPRRHFPLLGQPQAPGNKLNPPERGYKPGGMAPWGRRKSPVPRHTRQNRPEVRRPTEGNPRTGEERPHTNALERPRRPLYLSLRPTNARIWHKAVFKVGPVAGPKPTRVRQGQKYLQPRRHSPFWGSLRRQAINSTPPNGV